MSKQITAAELAEIVTRLLTDTTETGEMDGFETFQGFMTDIAKVVCDYCGGEVRHPADMLDDVWYVGIHGNDSLPRDGGIWREYDKEGGLFHDAPLTDEQWAYAVCKKAGIWLVNDLASEALLELERRYPYSAWRHEEQNGHTKLGYREWVGEMLHVMGYNGI